MRHSRLVLAFCVLFALPLPAPAATDCPRIVSQSPYITHTLDWLGLKDCIVGVSRYDRLDRPRTGGVLDPDAEAIAVLQPDLMLTSDWIEDKAWQAVAPKGARAIRLHGFQRMVQIEDNLRVVTAAAGQMDGEARAQGFARAWRAKAGQVHAGGTRALLLSACGGTPYSFGRRTWLYDLFTTAGFHMVETAEKIRHIKPGQEVEHLGRLIEELKPQVVFIFERTLSTECAVIPPKTGVRIVNLDGEQFLHPAPVLLQGLDTLIANRAQWHKTP